MYARTSCTSAGSVGAFASPRSVFDRIGFADRRLPPTGLARAGFRVGLDRLAGRRDEPGDRGAVLMAGLAALPLLRVPRPFRWGLPLVSVLAAVSSFPRPAAGSSVGSSVGGGPRGGPPLKTAGAPPPCAPIAFAPAGSIIVRLSLGWNCYSTAMHWLRHVAWPAPPLPRRWRARRGHPAARWARGGTRPPARNRPPASAQSPSLSAEEGSGEE